MNRMTKQAMIIDGYGVDGNSVDGYIVETADIVSTPGGYTGHAIERLAKFENFYDDLINGQTKLTEDLALLRSEGKEKSVQFKELLTKKLVNVNVMILLKNYGLE
ncbi:MAG: hypothetical protein CVU86_07610 [Firmicutes bacterium HGW-Firmicutes-11]|nr:MAG: hypothetical protein CVU86_07610 [Firmicutes bacterium HGW-Firmicutes-11]